MSKKHFEAIAAEIKELYQRATRHESPDEKTGVCNVARSLARVFSEFNPRFDRHRFLSACGLQEDEI